jgi:uncharacterized protein
MNQQDQQAIDELFQLLYQGAQAGPRDPAAEARIQQHFQQGPPGLLYHMAQTLVGQQYALQEARAQLADCQQQSASQQQGGSPAGFAPPWRRGARQRGAAAPPPPYQRDYQPRTWQQPGGQGFLAGAGQLALGVGGGILAAEALSGILGGDGLFGGDRDDYGDRGDDGDRDGGGDRDDGQDAGGQDDSDGQDYGDGGFDGGGFDGDQGGW